MNLVKAIYKARKAFKKWRNDFKHDREVIQKNRVDNGKNDRMNISLLWQYYVHNRKTFNDIINHA